MAKRSRGGSGYSFETEVEVNGEPVEVTVVYSYSPGSPGRIYGPPENCYPPEGPEVDIEGIFASEDKSETDISKQLTEKQMESIIEQACEAAEEADRDAYEVAMEDRADAAREREWDRD